MNKIVKKYKVYYCDSGIIIIRFTCNMRDIDAWLCSDNEYCFETEKKKINEYDELVPLYEETCEIKKIKMKEDEHYEVTINKCKNQVTFYLIPQNLIDD